MVFAMAGVGLVGLAVTIAFGQETRDVQIVGVATKASAAAKPAGVDDLA